MTASIKQQVEYQVIFFQENCLNKRWVFHPAIFRVTCKLTRQIKGINTRYLLRRTEWLLVIIRLREDIVHMCAVSKYLEHSSWTPPQSDKW